MKKVLFVVLALFLTVMVKAQLPYKNYDDAILLSTIVGEDTILTYKVIGSGPFTVDIADSEIVSDSAFFDIGQINNGIYRSFIATGLPYALGTDSIEIYGVYQKGVAFSRTYIAATEIAVRIYYTGAVLVADRVRWRITLMR